MGSLGLFLGLSWPVLASLGLSWSLLGLSCASLGLSWASLWLSWGTFGSLLASPGPLLASLGRLLGSSWPPLGCSWASLFGPLGPRGHKRATKCPKGGPRDPKRCQNRPPKSDFDVSFFGVHFWTTFLGVSMGRKDFARFLRNSRVFHF